METVTLNLTKERAKRLYEELGKVRCWITGFHAGRNSSVGIPGEDSLRQVQLLLLDLDRTEGDKE